MSDSKLEIFTERGFLFCILICGRLVLDCSKFLQYR
jgi:hypothetical protein